MNQQDNLIENQILEALSHDKNAFEIFRKLSPSHKKEYVEWILSAKKKETKAARISKMIAMLKEKNG